MKAVLEIAKVLEDKKMVQPPEWAPFVKTGAHKERPPENANWWYVRAAAVLLKLAHHGPIGVNRMARMYGGRKNRGTKPEHKYDGSRNILRKILQQLTAAGLISHVDTPKKGKILSQEGVKLVAKSK